MIDVSKFDCNFIQMLLYKASTVVSIKHLQALPNEFWHSLFLKHWPEAEPKLDKAIDLLGMHYHYEFSKCIPIGDDLYNDTYFRITTDEKELIDRMAQDILEAHVTAGH